MSEVSFPPILNSEWETLKQNQTLEQFWQYAHAVVDGLNKGLYQNWQAAHALLSVMDMPFTEDDAVGDLLFLLPNLELPGRWNEESWQDALKIIAAH